MVRVAQDAENQMLANPIIWKALEESQNPTTHTHALLTPPAHTHTPLTKLLRLKNGTTLDFAFPGPKQSNQLLLNIPYFP